MHKDSYNITPVEISFTILLVKVVIIMQWFECLPITYIKAKALVGRSWLVYNGGIVYIFYN